MKPRTGWLQPGLSGTRTVLSARHRGIDVNDVAYHGRAAYLREPDALIVADLHVGRVAASNVDAPLDEGRDIVERIATHLDAVDPATFVVAGDILHVHGSVPTGTVNVLEDIVQTVDSAGATPVFVKGNHDTLLDELDISGDPRIVDEYRLQDGTVVCHGHEEPAEESDSDGAREPTATGPVRYVVGHEHPAIRIEGARHACFLAGESTYRDADVLVLPAFSSAASGTLVNRLGDAMSPVVGTLGRYRPVVVGEEPYEFPPLSEFAALL